MFCWYQIANFFVVFCRLHTTAFRITPDLIPVIITTGRTLNDVSLYASETAVGMEFYNRHGVYTTLPSPSPVGRSRCVWGYMAMSKVHVVDFSSIIWRGDGPFRFWRGVWKIIFDAVHHPRRPPPLTSVT